MTHKQHRRLSYQQGVMWIALNDAAGDPDALESVAVSQMISVCLLADLSGRDALSVANDVVRMRHKLIADGDL